MSGRIPKYFIDQLIARTDIVELIGGRVPLKKHGREHKACCPFHGEKTPSFTVVPEKQFYHCFGCGAHGTAIDFLMEHDHMSFPEAVEDLAERLGMEVPREGESQAPRPAPAEGLFTVLERAAELYRRELKGSQRAKDYFKARGVSGETAARFGLGYSPDAWSTVLDQLGASDAERQRLLQVGLIIERERKPGATGSPGHYDRFRDRVMFPIRDARGRTIGFGGRVLDKGEPKYLNSPETELFHKGRELYGLYEARQASRSLTRLLIVEGYMDVVRLHQAGITYAVATLGTATTPDHLARVFRICNELIFCFDGDRAGRAAAWRALENSLNQIREGRQIRFLFLPEGHDPDSLVGVEGREAFEERIKTAEPLLDYLVRHLRDQNEMGTRQGRARFQEMAKTYAEKMMPGAYQDQLLRAIELNANIDTGLVSAFDRLAHAKGRGAEAERSTATGTAPRPSLVRQAIHLLVQYPQIAESVADPDALAQLDRPGIPLLIEMLHELHEQPCSSTGALLERWRDRPNYEHLASLAARSSLIADAQGAADELKGAIRELLREPNTSRYEELLHKKTLTDAERAELQQLVLTVRRDGDALARRG